MFRTPTLALSWYYPGHLEMSLCRSTAGAKASWVGEGWHYTKSLLYIGKARCFGTFRATKESPLPRRARA